MLLSEPQCSSQWRWTAQLTDPEGQSQVPSPLCTRTIPNRRQFPSSLQGPSLSPSSNTCTQAMFRTLRCTCYQGVWRITPSLWRLRQKNCHEFKACLGYTVSSRPAKVTQQNPDSELPFKKSPQLWGRGKQKTMDMKLLGDKLWKGGNLQERAEYGRREGNKMPRWNIS